MKIYLASPLGFSPEMKPYLVRIKNKLISQGHEVFCPWEQKQFERPLECIEKITDYGIHVNR